MKERYNNKPLYFSDHANITPAVWYVESHITTHPKSVSRAKLNVIFYNHYNFWVTIGNRMQTQKPFFNFTMWNILRVYIRVHSRMNSDGIVGKRALQKMGQDYIWKIVFLQSWVTLLLILMLLLKRTCHTSLIYLGWKQIKKLRV